MSIVVSENLGIPKYKQIISSVEQAISRGDMKRGDKLPSINMLRNKYSLSRDTVLLAYNNLKTRGIIHSIPGKGYYVYKNDISVVERVFFFFDELNSFKEDLYNSFLSHINPKFEVDIFFHHFNPEVFLKIIHDNIGNYNSYVIMPANLSRTDEVIQVLPKEKVYILDQMHEELKAYPGIYQNFEKDIYNSLISGKDLLDKYNKLVLLFPEDKQPLGMKAGFIKFCNTCHFDYEVIGELKDRTLNPGEVYLIPDDRNLIRIIKSLKSTDLELAKDIGIISYNDTLLKEIVEGGITTISTDFKQMGKRLAEMITKKESIQIENPNSLIVRKSL